LNNAYGVEEARSIWFCRLQSLAFTIIFSICITLVMLVLVIGPVLWSYIEPTLDVHWERGWLDGALRYFSRWRSCTAGCPAAICRSERSCRARPSPWCCGRVAAHHDVGIAALLEVRIEDCFAAAHRPACVPWRIRTSHRAVEMDAGSRISAVTQGAWSSSRDHVPCTTACFTAAVIGAVWRNPGSDRDIALAIRCGVELGAVREVRSKSSSSSLASRSLSSTALIS
jgi:hypothetical protein